MSSTDESSFHPNESSSLNIREINETENDHRTCNGNIVHPNRYQVLINDDESSFENEVIAAKINVTHKPPSPKKDETNKNFPENGCAQLNTSKIIPGSTSYSNEKRPGRKILLLSDSILSRVQMRMFNKELTEGRAYRKYFPGATPGEIAHYCLPTLQKDVVIINAGTNSLPNDETCDISNGIINLVQICRNNGVK